MGKLSFLYLGLPIRANTRSKDVWAPVVENFQRPNLICQFIMSLFKMPVAMKEKLDLIRRDFLWEGHSNKKKLCWMGWCGVIKPKASGGLGLGS